MRVKWFYICVLVCVCAVGRVSPPTTTIKNIGARKKTKNKRVYFRDTHNTPAPFAQLLADTFAHSRRALAAHRSSALAHALECDVCDGAICASGRVSLSLSVCERSITGIESGFSWRHRDTVKCCICAIAPVPKLLGIDERFSDALGQCESRVHTAGLTIDTHTAAVTSTTPSSARVNYTLVVENSVLYLIHGRVVFRFFFNFCLTPLVFLKCSSWMQYSFMFSAKPQRNVRGCLSDCGLLFC